MALANTFIGYMVKKKKSLSHTLLNERVRLFFPVPETYYQRPCFTPTMIPCLLSEVDKSISLGCYSCESPYCIVLISNEDGVHLSWILLLLSIRQNEVILYKKIIKEDLSKHWKKEEVLVMIMKYIVITCHASDGEVQYIIVGIVLNFLPSFSYYLLRNHLWPWHSSDKF